MAKFHDEDQKVIYEPNHAIFKELIAEGIGIGIDLRTSLSDQKSAANIVFIPLQEEKKIHFGYIFNPRHSSDLLSCFIKKYFYKFHYGVVI